ncbi:hypothetical protein ONZ51_g12878 [Trametes cubensis]|nr:hypothetical protein ONZ51_g12878 [Trametes cubensis]
MIPLSAFTVFLGCVSALAAPASQPVTSLSDALVSKVKTNMKQIATHSWEIGTALEALTEFEWPSLSVFGGSLPPPVKLHSGEAADVIQWATQ